MRILHVCYSDAHGGGAIGAYRLHHAMVAAGVDSFMLVINRRTRDPRVVSARNPRLNKRWQRWADWRARILEWHRPANPVLRSLNLFPTGLDEVINSSGADVVQLHWIGNNTLSIAEIARIRKPLFWKLPDMWAFSGAEHYLKPGEPLRFKEGYRRSNRPRGDQGIDLNRWMWWYKRWAWRNLDLTVVTPSRWLARKAQQSMLFRRFDVHVIPNPIDLRVYAPADRRAARAALGLPEETRLVIFGTFGAVRDTRKGYQHLLAALPSLRKHCGPDVVQFLVFGADQTASEQIEGYTVHHCAATHDEAELVRYYNCGDAFVLPSELDNLPNVITEAMACGVPCVGFRCGGLPDQVDHLETGYLAHPYDAADLARGIEWVLAQDRGWIAAAARAAAERQADPRGRVCDYLRMYRDAMAGRADRGGAQGKLTDRRTEMQESAKKERVVLLEPSVIRASDTSHNHSALLACSEIFARAGCEVTWLVNRDADVPAPYGAVHRVFDYSIYDDYRRAHDTSRIEATTTASAAAAAPVAANEEILPPGERAYSAMCPVLDGLQLGAADFIVVPTADRFLVEALLMWALRRDALDAPSIHIVFMYEQADWMTGRYPFANMTRRLGASGLLNRRIFVYTETRRHANAVERLVDAPVSTFPFPVPPGEVEAAIDAPPSTAVPRIVGVVGRGRKDKGFRLLPDIITRFNELQHGEPVRFVIQDARAVDGLADVSARLREIPNVELLDEHIPEASYLALVKRSDVLLLPYDRKVYAQRGSAVIREAMAYAKPIVCTEGSSLTEALVCGNGLAAADLNGFARALASVFADLAGFGERAREAARRYRRFLLDNAVLCNGRLHPLGEVRVTLFAAYFEGDRPDLDLVQKVRRVGRAVDILIAWYVRRGGGEFAGAQRESLLRTYYQAATPWAQECLSLFTLDGDAAPDGRIEGYLRELLARGRVARIIAAETGIADCVRGRIGPIPDAVPVWTFNECSRQLFESSLDHPATLVSRAMLVGRIARWPLQIREALRNIPPLYWVISRLWRLRRLFGGAPTETRAAGAESTGTLHEQNKS